jgi:hypothetical protein
MPHVSTPCSTKRMPKLVSNPRQEEENDRVGCQSVHLILHQKIPYFLSDRKLPLESVDLC